MSNSTQNRVNAVLAEADITLMNNNLATNLSKLPLNTALTPEERLQYNAIDVNNKIFCDDVLAQAKAHGTGIIAPYYDLSTLENDLKLYTQLDEQEIQLQNLLKRVQDVKRIAGHEAYSTSTGIYQNFKTSCRGGNPECDRTIRTA